MADAVSPPLPASLAALVERLHAETPAGEAVSLDAIGDAIGVLAVTTVDIEAIFVALEAKGRRVGSAANGDPRDPTSAPGDGAAVGRIRGGTLSLGEGRLRRALDAARELRGELGRAPTRAEIAARAELDEDEVRHALELAKVMQRR